MGKGLLALQTEKRREVGTVLRKSTEAKGDQ